MSYVKNSKQVKPNGHRRQQASLAATYLLQFMTQKNNSTGHRTSKCVNDNNKQMQSAIHAWCTPVFWWINHSRTRGARVVRRNGESAFAITIHHLTRPQVGYRIGRARFVQPPPNTLHFQPAKSSSLLCWNIVRIDHTFPPPVPRHRVKAQPWTH